MKVIDSHWIKGLMATSRPEPAQQARRIVAMQLHIVLPVRAGVIAVVLYNLLYTGGFYEAPSTHSVALETLQRYFLFYLACNVAAGLVFFFWRRFPSEIFQWLAFTTGLLDGLFMAGLTFLTDGFGSITYWIFPGLIVLNAISIPLAAPQIILNLLISLFYFGAGILEAEIPWTELSTPPVVEFHHRSTQTNGINAATNWIAIPPAKSRRLELPYSAAPQEQAAIEPALPRVFVLLLLTVCCYGVQVLAERQRRALDEAREFATREGQLHSAGRLAAEFAHQIKNPLAIINNAAFSLQRSLRENKNSAAQQIEIIQEEVARADKVITQIMGYAQLSEGRVEKLDVIEELERTIAQVFPPAVPDKIKIHRDFGRDFPPLLMQRGHLSEVFVNLLLNAREALGKSGNVLITAKSDRDQSVEISICDDGPGIPPDKLERVFEAYYTTREKGTGLGLAIVKHNAELYGGKVFVESKLGQGAEFILTFPVKTLPPPPQT
jgi:signal transduction histidine kinase